MTKYAELIQKSEKFHSSLETLHYRGESWQGSQVQIGSKSIADHFCWGKPASFPVLSLALLVSRGIYTITSTRKTISEHRGSAILCSVLHSVPRVHGA